MQIGAEALYVRGESALYSWEGVDLRLAVIDAEDPVTPAGSGCKGGVNGPVSKEAGRIDALE
jgi:hypothetical protein